MGNPLFNQLNKPQNNEFNTFMQNPLQFLASKNLNIPEEFANNPQGAVQYLLNSGKMSQQQLNLLTQKAQQMGVKL